MSKKIVSSLLDTLIHDLNNSLTILNFSLDSSELSCGPIFSEIKSMERALSHISLLHNLEKNKYSFHKVDIVNLFHKVQEKYTVINNSINFKERVSHAWMDKGHELLILYVIEELLDNASRHGAENIQVELVKNGKKYQLKVEDDGIGFSSEDLALLFSAFYKTKLSKEKRIRGFGLGLFTINTILHYLNAKMEVERKDAKTVFTVYF